MQTRCPQCQTIAPLEADRPKDEVATFVCASCGASFDAYAHLTDALPPDPVAAVFDADATTGNDATEAFAKVQPPPIDQGELFARPRPASAPRFARERIRIAQAPQWRWWIASLTLLILLLAIYPIANRNVLARDANWRPTLQKACNTLGCTLPPWGEMSAFEVTAREVGPHPSVKGALLITVTFHNKAAFAQAWPMLELTFSDVNGRLLGLRRFEPQEYLGGAPKTPLIRADQSASATLEVVNPGREAVAYNFDFR